MNASGTPRSGPGPGQILFEFVRHWSRRSLAADPQTAEQGRLVLVTEAVHAITRRRPATINAIAHEIGIDQSGASRLVKAAVAAGHLELQAPETDGRRRHVTVTPAGLTMLDHAHAWQESVFTHLTEDWTDRQRTDFKQAMLRLLARSHTLDS